MAMEVAKKELIPIMGEKLAVEGMNSENPEDALKYGLWKELSFEEKAKRVLETPTLGKYEVKRVSEVFQELLLAGRIRDAQSVLNKFFQSVKNSSREVRTEVADNVPAILKILDRTSKDKKTFRLAYTFLLETMEQERDSDVLMRLAGSLSFVATQMINKGNLTDGIEIIKILADSGRIRNDSRFEGEKHHIFRTETILRILAALGETKGEERVSLFQVVLKLGDLAIGPILETMSQEKSMGIRAKLSRTVSSIGEPAVDHLIPRLADGRLLVVRDVAAILGDIKSEKAVEPLIDVAQHADPRVRKEALIALSKIATARAKQSILNAFKDTDSGILALISDLAAKLEMREAIPIVLKMVKKKEKFQSIEMEPRRKAITALARLAPERAFEELAGFLEKKGLFAAEECTEIKVSVALALGFSGNKKALEILQNLSTKDSKALVREAAQKAISMIKCQTQ